MVHDEDEYSVGVIGRGVDVDPMGDEYAGMTDKIQVSSTESLVHSVVKS